MNAWEMAQSNIVAGRVVAESYRVASIDEKGFTLTRIDSGKDVRIARKMVESTAARLLAGETLKYQASGPDGGISYTVAIVRGVEAALSGVMVRDESIKAFRLATGAAARLTGAA